MTPEQYVEHRKATVERWSDKDGKPHVAVSYWHLFGKERRKIHRIGTTLAEAVQKCRDAEEGKTAEAPPANPNGWWYDPSAGWGHT